MLFNYTAVSSVGSEKRGTIEAVSQDAAITALQRRGLIVVSVLDAEKKSIFEKDLSFLQHIKTREVVILSRQIATMFDAQVSALQVFGMLAAEVENPLLARKLQEVTSDIQGGSTISSALAKHPSVFSNFYVNMVRSGEESGKLSETFLFLADYLERNYELTSKARSALIYPVFVILVFVIVMVLLLTLVIPKLSVIIKDSGKEPPVYTKIVMGVSDFLINYGIIAFLILATLGFVVWYMERIGLLHMSQSKLNLPVFGGLYKKLYLSRVADNLHTMLSSGVSIVKAVEVTADVVGDPTYAKIMQASTERIKAGSPMSEALDGYPEIPRIMVLMFHVGEETGQLAPILAVMAKFYRREVEDAIEGVISLIEPAMIVMLGLGVGVVLASVLMPIYDIAGSIS